MIKTVNSVEKKNKAKLHRQNKSNQNDSTLNGPYENACVKCNYGNVLMIFPLPSQDLYRSLNFSSSKKSGNLLNLD